LFPVLLSCLMGMVFVWVVFSQEPILHQMREQQERAMSKKLEHMSKAERDKVLETVQKISSPLLIKLFGTVGVPFATFTWLFFVALVCWALGRLVFKVRFGYMKAVEMCALAGMVVILGTLMHMLLAVNMGSITATASPALLIREFQPANKIHQVAASFNLATLWYMGVLAVGLGRLSDVSAWKAFFWLFTLWAIPRGLMILTGWAAQGM